MRNTSIQFRLGSVLGSVACLLLAGLVCGCSDEGASPKSVTAASAKGSTVAPTDASAKPAVAAESKTAKQAETTADKAAPDAGTVKIGVRRRRCRRGGQGHERPAPGRQLAGPMET